MTIVGAVGAIGSGKDTVISYISTKSSMPIISIGDIARDIVKSEGLPLTREHLQQITVKYYEKFGKTYFIEETVNRIKRSRHDKVLITGIRAPTDVETLRKNFLDDFILISVTADKRKRFQRLKMRGDLRDPKTWREFLEQDQNEEKIFHINESCKLANYRIDNNGTFQELFQKIDKILEGTQ
jgi:dephospho-CoA kinase